MQRRWIFKIKRQLKRLALLFARTFRLAISPERYAGADRIAIFDKRTCDFGCGKAIDKTLMEPWRGGIPAFGVWRLPSVHILADRGLLLTKRMQWILNGIALNPSDMHTAITRPIPLAGTTAIILTDVARNNYYHFFIDTLPKLDLVMRSGIAIDRYVVHANEDYQREAYEILGIADKIVAANHNSHFYCEQVIYPDKLTQNRLVASPHFNYMLIDFQLDWALDFLSNSLPRADSVPNAPKRLYVSRARARGRQAINEAELVALLRRYHVETIYLEDFSLSQKISIAQNADLIIGAFGAGLTNIVFCRPGTRIIELVPDLTPQHFFQMIAYLRKLDYSYLACDSITRDALVSDYDLCVPLPILENALKAEP